MTSKISENFKQKYLNSRRHLLIQKNKLQAEKLEIMREIRNIDKELKGWDNILIIEK